MKTAILSSTYFGPVQWYQKLNRYDNCIIEQYDNFIKQTYRNRCLIPAANGIQALTIPVERPAEGRIDKTLMKDIRISEHGNWRHLHWNALMSAYGESPFFEYYADDIRPFFEKRWDYLLDFNLEITMRMCELLDIRPQIKFSESYWKTGSEELVTVDKENRSFDFRDAIRPKHAATDTEFRPEKYYQVYQQKYGFLPNMSILDLLFNEGNEAVFYL